MMDERPMRFADLRTAASLVTAARLGVAAAAPFWAPWPGAWAIYLLAVGSDVLDGAIARRTGTASRAGAAFDAWVDKILHVNLGWSLAVADRIPDAWMLAWCARELIQGPLVPVLIHRFRVGHTAPNTTSLLGRATAVLLAVSVLTVLLGGDATVTTGLTGLAGSGAGLAYAFRHFRRPLTKASRGPVVPLEAGGRAA